MSQIQENKETVFDFKEFKSFTGTINAVNKDVTVRHNQTGTMHVRCMDSSNVSLLDAKMRNTNITDTMYGMDINNLWNTLKTLKTDSLAYSLDRDQGRINMFTGTVKANCRAMIEANKKLDPLPNPQLTSTFEIGFSELKSMLQTISSKSDFFTMRKGGMDGKGDQGEISVENKAMDKVRDEATYSLEFLRTFLKNIYCATKESKVVICFSTAKPMYIEFTSANFDCVYWLAPRVEN